MRPGQKSSMVRNRGVRGLLEEERSEYESEVPFTFRVSLWESFLPDSVLDIYFKICKSAFLQLDKKEQDDLLNADAIVYDRPPLYQKRSNQRFSKYFPNQRIDMEFDEIIGFLLDLGFIFEVDFGLYDVHLYPRFPEDVINLDLWKRCQLETLRYHRFIISSLLDIHKNVQSKGKIYFHLRDLIEIFGNLPPYSVKRVLDKAQRDAFLKYEFLDAERVYIIFDQPKVTLPNIESEGLLVLNVIEYPLVEISIDEIGKKCFGGDRELARKGLVSLQEREMVISDEPLHLVDDYDRLFIELVL